MKNLENLFLLNGLDGKDKNAVIKSFNQTVKFKKGDTIYSSELFKNAIGYVINGKATAVTNNVNNIHLRTFEKGSCFGVAAIFGGKGSYVSTITAATDIEILFITEEELRSVFFNYPQTATNYIEFLSDKIRFLNTKLSVISCTNADDAVFRYLSFVCDSSDGTVTLKGMSLLASSLGLSRATLYRCLDSLQADGKILRENNTIKVIKNEKTN